jgi:uncharacterized protein YqgC (DUF456 family)
MAFVILVLVLLLSLVMIALGLPGIWIMIATAVVYNLIVPGGPISWFTIVGIGVLGVIAEVIEFSMAGKFARKYGGSKRAGWWAIFGGMIGAFMGFPVPIVGPMIGAFVGSFVGALAGELSLGTGGGQSAKVATGAMLGRVAATAVKIAIGCTIASWIFFAAMG